MWYSKNTSETTGTTAVFEFTVSVAADIYIKLTEVKTKKDEILNQITNKGLKSNYAKLRYIHDYLVTYINNKNAQSGDLYGALVLNAAVSNGYANAFQYISRQLGINCIIIRAGKIGTLYAYNYVELDGKWYAIDTYADDPITDDTNLESGLNENLKVDYFLSGSNYVGPNGEILSEDPIYVPRKTIYGISDWLEYPELEENDYIPSDEEISEVNKFTTYKEK
eukprot:jgi/Orpsp1_1/1192622/evm.model.d7180000094683.1